MRSRLYSHLRQARLNRRRTLVSVATKAQITFQQLSVIESGNTDVRLSSIEKVAAELGYQLMLIPLAATGDVRRLISLSTLHPERASSAEADAKDQ